MRLTTGKEIKNLQDSPTLKISQVRADENVTKRLINGLSDELQKLLGTKVSIEYNSGKGKISINFYSDEELTSFVDKLKEGCQS